MHAGNSPIHIRKFEPGDTPAVAMLFHETIRTINTADYSEQQLCAWAPDEIHFRDWKSHCLQRYTLVAEKDGKIVGFAQLEEDGHIDCFYTHHQFQDQGVGTALYESIEQHARIMGLGQLRAEASITARQFFLGLGFRCIRRQQVITRGVKLHNYLMAKKLTGS